MAGYTSRVHNMFKVMDDVNKGVYQKGIVNTTEASESEERFDTSKIEGIFCSFFQSYFYSCFLFSNSLNTVIGKKEISSGEIELINVPIVTPNGDVVVRNMSIKVMTSKIKDQNNIVFNFRSHQECTS